ncbi:fumarylacetoacetate hydrolase family protein [Pusillimonas noertemannii]|uniref:fumarylacetoacetate hydrolase family protein n=1 Tax=Pusillimonas noertemannii TaxID=305977 RepID=UPI0012FE4D03|nr:fumarylacetoacetate hydrolase family protein [Pusillimonas noertemannii]
MKLATFSLPTSPDSRMVGVLRDGFLHRVNAPSMKALLAEGPDRLADLTGPAGSEPGYRPEEVIFHPPVPDPGKFLCVGKNYRAHLEELKRTSLIKEMPDEPTGFVKLNECLTGHGVDVPRPKDVHRLDYEPEMVFVLGKSAYQVKPDDALSYVAGITLLNDLTCRDTQKREVASGTRFWTAKNAPGFGPLGPYVITMDEVSDPYNIWVTCRVNGELRMRVNTSEQIWRLARIIEHFSRLVPLMPGDLISTGAPGGVAVGKANAEALFLKPGDVVECAFEAPEMVLRNRIVAA